MSPITVFFLFIVGWYFATYVLSKATNPTGLYKLFYSNINDVISDKRVD